MRLDDLPAIAVPAIDFGAVPAIFILFEVRDVIECQHSGVADDLHQRSRAAHSMAMMVDGISWLLFMSWFYILKLTAQIDLLGLR